MNENILTKRERREIAGRARTLYDRLDGPSNCSEGEPPIEPDRILREWRNRFPDDESFQRRLAREGLTEENIRKELTATCWPTDEPLPNWIDELETLIEHVKTYPADERTIASSDETAFVELLTAIADYARNRLPEHLDPINAISPLVDWLIDRLEMVCTRPLYVEFKSFLEYYDPELARINPDEVTNPTAKYYDRFVDSMFDGGVSNLCLEYPVLARHLVRLVDNWVETVTEVCRRVQTDQSALRERFGVDGDVTALEPLAEDAHAHGRVPIRVSFESNDVIYKPREVDAGITFYTVLGRLAEHLSVSSFRIPTYLSRDGYGWMESVEYDTLPSKAAAGRYYEQAGAMLCVAYILNLTDCQFENIIAAGEHPVIVDAETTFHPRVDPMALPLPREVSAFVNQSVLLTALLPFSATNPRNLNQDGQSKSITGFGIESGQTKLTNRTRPVIEAANTDVMSVKAEAPTISATRNTPTVDDDDQPPGKHIDVLVRGFERAYETIRELHADGQFFSEIVSPEMFTGVENRLIYRPSMQYSSVLRSTVARNPLRDGAMLTVEIDELAVPFFDGQIERGYYWQLFVSERKSLRRLDIPRFTCYADKRTVCHDGTPVGVMADKSGFQECRQRLDEMNSADRRQQVWLIRQCYDSISTPRTPPKPVETTDERLREEAVDMFEDVIDAANSVKYEKSWLAITPTSSDLKLFPVDASLYNGRGGVALTAAALHEVTGQNQYRRFATETLEPVLEDSTNGSSLGLGGLTGTGSVVYTLSVIADLLNDDTYRRKALKIAQTVTKNRLREDDVLDVMKGTAGTLLGLLAFHDRYPESEVLNRAVACGERLLETRITIDGSRVWYTITEDSPLAGFAHGISGIAYALARLAAKTDEHRYAQAAREALDFALTLHSSGQPNRTHEHNGLGSREWCHGQAGITLAHIGISEQLDEKSVIDGGNVLPSETENANPLMFDNVCCGNFGRVETLLVESNRADGEFSDATELAGRCLSRREREGTLSLPGHAKSFTNPTFFDGISGAVYTLLRLRNPDVLPCVLLLE